jgi:sarcosine oxidase
MAEEFDVIVAGLGAFGACACEALARRGARVLGLDRHGIPHALGSSHGAARAIRLCYYEHPDYVPLLQLAYQSWGDLARRSGVEVLLETGGLYIGRPDGELVPGSREAAERHGLPHEMLDRDEAAVRYPQFDIPPDLVAMHEPRAGVLFPERLIGACARLAMQDGAVLAGMDPVTSWRVSGDAVEVATAQRRCRARRLILCAGPWTRRLLPDLDLPLAVTRQVQGWIAPRRPELFTPDRFPIWGFEEPGEKFHYGFPLLPDRPGLKRSAGETSTRSVPPPCGCPTRAGRS